MREIEEIRDLGADVFLRKGKNFLHIWNAQVMRTKMWVLLYRNAGARVKPSLVSPYPYQINFIVLKSWQSGKASKSIFSQRLYALALILRASGLSFVIIFYFFLQRLL